MIIYGDVLDVLQGTPDETYSGCFCDPPYALSNNNTQGLQDRLTRILPKIMLPNLDKMDAQTLQQIELGSVSLSGSDLSRREAAAVIKSWIGVPKGAVDFDNGIVIGQEEISAGGISACGQVSDAVLVNGHNASGGEFLGDYVLYLGDPGELTGGNGGGSLMAEFFSSGFAVPVVPQLLPGSPSPLSRFCSVVLADQVVGFADNSLGEADTTPLVLADGGAVNTFMLRFDMSGGTVKLFATYRASHDSAIAEAVSPKLIRTFPATGGLPAMFKPVRVGMIGFTADRTGSFHFHLWLPEKWADILNTIIPSGGFMGKNWDAALPDVEVWKEIYRVLKPGAVLMAFGGTRTWHRLAVNIEDAGFEMFDTLMWLYGSGFPKSTAIDKAIDKENGRKFEDRYALGRHIKAHRQALGISRETVNQWLGAATKCEHYESESDGFARVPTLYDWLILKERLNLSDEFLSLVERAEAERKIVGYNNRKAGWFTEQDGHNITAPATDAARAWQGYGSALKPAHEPVLLFRKPRRATYAQTALQHGTGAIWVDGGRIPTDDDRGRPPRTANQIYGNGNGANITASENHPAGRWPANVVLDDEAGRLLDAQSGERKGATSNSDSGADKRNTYSKGWAGIEKRPGYGDTGGASRFFQKCSIGAEDMFCILCDVHLTQKHGIMNATQSVDVHQGDTSCNANTAVTSSSQSAQHNGFAADHAPHMEPQDGGGKWEKLPSLADNAELNLRNTLGTNGFSAPNDAKVTAIAKNARNAKYAESLCDTCITNIAVALVAIKCSDSNRGELQASLAYMPDYKSSTLIQSLVSFAELWENTDTTPTTASLSILFGSVHHAIASYTKLERNGERVNIDNAPTRFRYSAKASRAEREAGLEGLPLRDKPGLFDDDNYEWKQTNGHVKAAPARNHHPCVKPLALTEYLARLIVPPVEYRDDARLLVPFAGSMSEAIGAYLAGWRNIDAIESEADYVKMGGQRFEWWKDKIDQSGLSDPDAIRQRYGKKGKGTQDSQEHLPDENHGQTNGAESNGGHAKYVQAQIL